MLTEVRGTVQLTLHVQPGARRTGVVGIHGDALKVAVKARPVDGRANDAITAVVARAFELPLSAVSIVSGHSARRKVVALAGISLAEAQAQLHSLLSPAE
ncbi:MAG: DUF167 domain-containing protein [Gemmatimonadota bacterium]|nr:DUF167 domain-containing protein [Gemmatimonadota bacterium]